MSRAREKGRRGEWAILRKPGRRQRESAAGKGVKKEATRGQNKAQHNEEILVRIMYN